MDQDQKDRKRQGDPVPGLRPIYMEETGTGASEQSGQIFTVVRITEADYGCEELPEGEAVRVDVLLEAQDGTRHRTSQEDDWLYEVKITEGSRVTFAGGRLVPVETQHGVQA